VRTSDHLREYAFRLRLDDDPDPMRVRFELAEKTEGKGCLFVPGAPDFVEERDDELVLRFEYRPAALDDRPEDQRDGKTTPPDQSELIRIAVQRLRQAPTRWNAELPRIAAYLLTNAEPGDG